MDINDIIFKHNIDIALLSRDYYLCPLKRLKRNIYGKKNELIPKKDLYYIYIICNCRQIECAKIFNVTIFNIKHDLKYYEIKKPQKQVKELMKETINSPSVQFSYELIYDFYIIQNLSIKEISKKLNISNRQVKRLLKTFKINKPKDKAIEVATRFRKQKNAFNGSISQGEIAWLNDWEISERHRQYPLKILNKTYFLDGYDPYEKTIYSYLGDFWHGNPKIYKKDDINPVSKKTYGYLYNKTIEEFNLFIDCGFLVKYIWDSEYKMNFKKYNKNYSIGKYFKKGDLI